MAKTAHKALSTQKMGQAKKVGVNTQVSTQEKDLNQHELNQATIAGLSASKKKALATEKELNTKPKQTEVIAEKTSHSDAQADADVAVLADVDQNYNELQSDLAKFDTSWNQTQSHSGWGNIIADAAQSNVNPWVVAGAAVGVGAVIAIANNNDDDNDSVAVAPDIQHEFFNYMGDAAQVFAAESSSSGSFTFTVDDGLTREEANDYKAYVGEPQETDNTPDIDARGFIANLTTDVDYADVCISASSTADSEVIWLNTVGIENSDVTVSNITADICINAYAYSSDADFGTRADAEVAIHHLYINLTAQDTVDASIVSIYASATGSAVATIVIGDINVKATATATEGDAYAYLSDISAYAYNNADVRISIDSILVSAYAVDFASATIDTVYAYASSSAHAAIVIGNIDIVANSENDSAYAYMYGLSAEADNTGTATVSVGNVTMLATVQDGDGYASISNNSYIAASADDNGVATLTVGDISMIALGQGDGAASAYAKNCSYIYASAEDSGIATATIGNILISATGVDDAYASNSYIYATATSHGIANLTVGNVTIEAKVTTSGTASAYQIEDIYADASEQGYASIIMGDLTIRAEALIEGDVYAYMSSIYASADYRGIASLEIGDIVISADTNEGDAYASFYGSIYATASDQAQATVTIGNITITANSLDGSAYANQSFSNAYIGAYAFQNGVAQLTIGDFKVHADAVSAYAEASVYLNITASGSGTATFDIGNIDVRAHAHTSGNAYADWYELSAYAYDDGVSTINAKDVTIAAVADSGSASAYLDYVAAYASDSGAATVNVGNITVSAAANVSDESAYASVNQIIAYASATSEARITINGDINISAYNSYVGDDTSGTAYAYLSYLTVSATSYGVATIDVLGSINIEATASNTADAYAYFTVNATSTSSIANFSVAGDINISAHGYDSSAQFTFDVDGAGVANIEVGNIYLEANSVNADFINTNTNTKTSINIGNVYVNLLKTDDDDGYASVSVDNFTWDKDGTLSITGEASSTASADIVLDSNENHNLSFGRIDLTGMDGNDVNILIGNNSGLYNDADYSFAIANPLNGVKYTTIYGWENIGSGSSLSFGNLNSTSANNFTVDNDIHETLNALWESLDASLDTDTELAFARFDENTAVDANGDKIDLNGDGVFDSNLGVLAYDLDTTDNDNFTSIIFFSGLGLTDTLGSDLLVV